MIMMFDLFFVAAITAHIYRSGERPKSPQSIAAVYNVDGGILYNDDLVTDSWLAESLSTSLPNRQIASETNITNPADQQARQIVTKSKPAGQQAEDKTTKPNSPRQQAADATTKSNPPALLTPDGAILKRRHSPHNHVTFIKTHKCASSTIQNILMRYGLKHNLTFTLPKGDGNHIGWPSAFKASQLRPSKQPDIHCYHSVLSKELLEFMPKDAFNLASVRDPFTQLRSAYIYYSWHGCSQKSLVDLINDAINKPTMFKVCGSTPVKNPVLFDLGMVYTDMDDKIKVEEYIKMLDSTFHLVIVVDYFYESIIIMRDMLGWSNREVASFVVNFRSEVNANDPSKVGADMPTTSEFRQRIYDYLYADKALYDHFKSKIETIISANKNYIQQEVAALKKYQNEMMEFCVIKSVPNSKITDSRFKPWGNGAQGYILTPEGLKNDTCIEMASSELNLVKFISKQQPPL